MENEAWDLYKQPESRRLFRCIIASKNYEVRFKEEPIELNTLAIADLQLTTWPSI
jgi:hypothetical protein